MFKRVFTFAAVAALAAAVMTGASAMAAQAAELAPKELTTALEQWFNGDDAAAMPAFKKMVEADDKNPIPYVICREAYYMGKYESDDMIRAKYAGRMGSKNAADYFNAAADTIYAAANAGKPRAEFLAGVMLGDVPGVEKRGTKSGFAWLLSAAEHGDPNAQSWVGYSYHVGQYGAAVSFPKARKWLRKAVAQGNKNALCNLASSHIVKKSTGYRDVDEGTKLYKQAAQKGFARGEFRYGRSLLLGWGVAKNVKEAVKWLDKAARKHNYQAAELLADLYRTGEEGVTKDDKLVAEYVRLKREFERERDRFSKK